MSKSKRESRTADTDHMIENNQLSKILEDSNSSLMTSSKNSQMPKNNRKHIQTLKKFEEDEMLPSFILTRGNDYLKKSINRDEISPNFDTSSHFRGFNTSLSRDISRIPS